MDDEIQEIMRADAFLEGIEELSREINTSRSRVEQMAERSFREMIACHEPIATAAWRTLGRALSRHCRVHVDNQALVRLRELDQAHSIVWLPSHRSYLDMFFLEDVIQEAGISPAFVLGGDNLDFWPVGPVLRRAGLLYIRRNTHDDPVYRFALRSYLAHLVKEGRNLTWSIEGGRSRTGKLRPPCFGALRYVVDAAKENPEQPDVMVVPVSVVYDQLAEVATMTAEARGSEKKPEGIGWLLRFAKLQAGKRSNVRIDLDEPMPMRERISEIERDPRSEGKVVERLAVEICHRINRVTPAVPTAVVAFALLGAERALTLEETLEAMAPMLVYLRAHPTAPNTLEGQLDDPGWVRTTLDELAESGVLERYTGGDEIVWQIAPDQHLVAAFYRNTLIHLLVTRAIAELAMFMAREHAMGELTECIWNHAMSLRQLLKFEFFFASRSEFQRELLKEVALFDPEWEGRGLREPIVTSERLDLWIERSKPHLAHIILRPFFDAYLVVAEQLTRWPHDRPVDPSILLDRCLGYGHQQVLRRKIHSPESVSLELFRNALKLAEHRGLLSNTGREAREQRKAFASHVRRVAEDLQELSTIQRGPRMERREEPLRRRPAADARPS